MNRSSVTAAAAALFVVSTVAGARLAAPAEIEWLSAEAAQSMVGGQGPVEGPQVRRDEICKSDAAAQHCGPLNGFLPCNGPGVCDYCLTDAFERFRYCTAQEHSDCPRTGTTSRTCGPRYTGACTPVDGVWRCQGTANGTCGSIVDQCTL